MVRLYLTGFQAIQEGLSLRDRYDGNQLKGQNVLVDNGQTELGKALIILVQTVSTPPQPSLVDCCRRGIPCSDRCFRARSSAQKFLRRVHPSITRC